MKSKRTIDQSMNSAMSFAEMSNPRDFLSSPALSLSLAGIFRATEGSGGAPMEETVEISSENSSPAKSDDEFEEQHSVDDAEEEDENNGRKKKKRKKYHRHTPEQIREMEALFKESPHLDEKQRLQLSKQLGLHPSCKSNSGCN